jgi:hypothetical protein
MNYLYSNKVSERIKVVKKTTVRLARSMRMPMFGGGGSVIPGPIEVLSSMTLHFDW